MGNTISKGTLFTPELTSKMYSLVKGKSSLAKLANQQPIAFNGERVFTFNFDKEVDLLDENGAKSNGGATVAAKNIVPLKIEYGTRISKEFLYANESVQLDVMSEFADGFAKKVARGIDLMAFHGINPRTKAESTLIGDNCFDKAVTQSVSIPKNGTDGNAAVESAIALVQSSEYDVSGIAMAPALRSMLAAQTKTDGSELFPELGWGNAPGTIRGLAVDVNSTVSFNSSADRAIVGDFQSYFRWGYARDVQIEIIQYGNPDNDSTLGDLAGHNQVYLRGETLVGWAILLPEAFARIVQATA